MEVKSITKSGMELDSLLCETSVESCADYSTIAARGVKAASFGPGAPDLDITVLPLELNYLNSTSSIPKPSNYILFGKKFAIRPR